MATMASPPCLEATAGSVIAMATWTYPYLTVVSQWQASAYAAVKDTVARTATSVLRVTMEMPLQPKTVNVSRPGIYRNLKTPVNFSSSSDDCCRLSKLALASLSLMWACCCINYIIYMSELWIICCINIYQRRAKTGTGSPCGHLQLTKMYCCSADTQGKIKTRFNWS